VPARAKTSDQVARWRARSAMAPSCLYSARRAKAKRPTALRSKITGMLADHLIHLHVMQSSITTAPAPNT